jgi:hypothetical protein
VRPEGGENPAAVPVARLTYTNGCIWGGVPAQARSIESQVGLGDEIVLDEGIAEFRLSSGVSLSIEGPTVLVVTSPTSFVLQHGTMTVYVPWSAADFQMVAGTCRLTAIDAEFGVRVAGGDVKVDAFADSVVASPALGGEESLDAADDLVIRDESQLPRGAEFKKVRVTAGRSLSLATRSDITKVAAWTAADDSQFATRLSMAGPLPIEDSYIEAVRESQPFSYWRFENVQDEITQNEMAGGAPLKVVGNVRFAGEANNHVVELGRPGANGYLVCTEKVDLSQSDYSVEVWVKPSHFHNGACVGLLKDVPVMTREKLAFYLQVCSPQLYWEREARQRFRFLHRSPPGHDHLMGTNCYSKSAYSLRRWQHVVATKQGAEMALFVDGVQVAAQRDATSLPPDLTMIVGQLTNPERNGAFVGQLDEIAIYKRALTPEEVKQHGQAVNWKGVPPSGRQQRSI